MPMPVESNITQAEQLLATFWSRYNSQQLTQAQAVSTQLTTNFASFSPGWHAASVVNLGVQQNKLALQHIDKALTLNPQNTIFLLHKIRVLLALSDRENAKNLAITLSQKQQTNPTILAELALLLNSLGLYQASLTCYQQALLIQPDNPGLLFNLASLQRYMGLLSEAEVTLDRLITLNPHDSEAWLLRSGLRRQQHNNHHIDDLKNAIQNQQGEPISQAQLYYALGKEQEDLQRYDECFSAYQQGALVRRRNMQYSLTNDLATLNKITDVFTHNLLQQNIKGSSTTQPIFILGLPRTGSTLVERIIGSHSDVHSAGELNNFALQMMAQLRQTQRPPVNKLELIEMTSKLDFAKLGEDYIGSTQPDTSTHARFIDKLPLNSLYVGLIHLAMPHAKIIHVQRHPLDSCYAIYKQLFTHGYPFSYDLNELAQYQIAHHKLMQHWQKVLPGVMHVVQYEKLVADFPVESKTLLAYCDLPWQPQCGQFEQNSAAATTASAAQVRQPIYNSSVGKWRHFSTQLASVRQQFEQAGILCD
jgi:tetratricopeptide (TPR) repeat protein